MVGGVAQVRELHPADINGKDGREEEELKERVTENPDEGDDAEFLHGIVEGEDTEHN